MLLLYGGLFFALLIRIFYIQATGVVDGQKLEAKAAALYGKEAVLTAERGKILDRNGNVIAEDTLSYRLIAVVNPQATKNSKEPRHVVDPAETAKVLAKHIPMEETEIYKILTKKLSDGRQPYQVEFGVAGRSISHDKMEAIKKEKLSGITFASDTKRYYPNGPFASHLIGFAQKENQDDGTFQTIGKMGLESIYNKELSGKNGTLKYESDIFGYLLPNSEKMVEPAENGDDIYLTLDKTIQNFLEESMSKVYEQYNPESIVAVVANPKTGEILAMSQRPTFDPDTRVGLENGWLNEVIENVIEPGSTLKTFTLATAIETGNWHPNATFQSGSYTILDRTIRDHNYVGWGKISYLEGFQRSANTSMAYLLQMIGDETFIDYLQKFGFGDKTGIDLPGEATGTLLATYPINRVTTSFGQGSTVTPIQLIQAMTAIANDGKMMQPYVINKIVDANGKTVKQTEPTMKGEPISAETAKQVRELLASTITSEVGTAKRFALEGYTVGGKTGTAQIARPGGGYFSGKNNYLYSFLGLAPVEDPQLIVYVAVKKPQLAVTEGGSEPVAAIFNTVVQNSLKYLNINPENVAQVEKTSMGDYIGHNVESAQVELTNQGLTPIIIGEGGTIIDQYPDNNLAITKGSLVFLKTDGVITLPSFDKWSLRNVLVYKSMSGLPIETVGEGYVESQSVSPNTIVVDSSPIVVKLKTPEEMYTEPLEETSAEGEILPQD
ncbi:penicillin-binding transpeptidase domain-containing protein [Lysinibacillus sp. BW-2-10]|uniref:penicillin-binding transpeptidase domain-containing protein n=1 Tax=Lysinibacillus sp. BW-2-10 TaxID=2590030 RepID=UPI00117D47CC|nr:penicillin-binding transpeptidase domain-containing protein [Lysinibacillus sp. BW-2-10]TSI11512.1 PASTA domain-containing protein [Lysinibacillus sp. BW-2-10]